MRRKVWIHRGGYVCLAIVGLFAMQPAMAVEYANINVVDGADPINDPPTVSIAGGQGTAGFFIEPDPVTGLYPIRIGPDATDDAANGVLLGYVRETGRDQLDSLGGTETLYATSATSRGVDGSLSLVVRRAGDDSPNTNTLYAPGSVFNADVAAAYFPFSEGWLAGSIYNEFNGSVLNEMVASGGMTLADNFQQDVFGTGDHVITLPGVTDTRRQGLLFVNGARNEGNYALSEPTANGSGFTITGHDNASNGSAGEVDPVSFVFMPLGTPNVTMARIFGRGHGPTQDPVAMIQSGGDFTISRESPGEYRLSIDGQTPSSGTLLVSPSGANDGGNGNNSDNVVTYRADGNDWVILAQDLPGLDGNGQESGDRAESYFSFAFMPFNAPPTAPGSIPAVETLTTFSKERVIGWNAHVSVLVDGNSPGNMYIDEPQQTSNVNIVSLFENKGDNVFAVDGAFLAKSEGVMFATISEGLRDNSDVGGFFEYGVLAVSQTNDDEWWVHTSAADPILNGEHNINFSVAFFGADSGFEMGQHIATPGGALEVVVPAEDSLTDGALFVTVNATNQGNFVTATPKVDGTGWDIGHFDADTTAAEESVNHIYLPFDTENLIAGRVAGDGTIDASTDQGEFSLTRDATGEYVLTIPGKSPEDGMLLLTSTGEGDSSDNSVVYETSGTDFRILGLDMISEDDANGGAFVSLEDTSFTFAYIDFDAPPMILNEIVFDADFNDDGIVDGDDFLVWQSGFGGSGDQFTGDANGDGVVDGDDFLQWQQDFGGPPSGDASAAVPEPTTSALMLLTALVVAAARWSLRRSNGSALL